MGESYEVRAKHTNYTGNSAIEFFKRFYDWGFIVENYIHGDAVLHIHGGVGRSNPCLMLATDSIFDVGCGDVDEVMLVIVGKVSEPGRPVATVKWLQPLSGVTPF